jgi:hypothetical protein
LIQQKISIINYPNGWIIYRKTSIAFLRFQVIVNIYMYNIIAQCQCSRDYWFSNNFRQLISVIYKDKYFTPTKWNNNLKGFYYIYIRALKRFSVSKSLYLITSIVVLYVVPHFDLWKMHVFVYINISIWQLYVLFADSLFLSTKNFIVT